MLSKILLAITAVAGAALAAVPTAIVTIETSHGGAGNDLTNTTVTIPLNKAYTNTSALDEVSYLFLTGASGVPLDSITCTPFRYMNGSGTGGLPFNSTDPSYLSTNDVQVGSIVCTSGSMPAKPPGGGSNSSSSSLSRTMSVSSTSSMAVSSSVASASATSAASPSAVTSTFLTTVSGSGGVVQQSTVTSVVVPPVASASSAAVGASASAGAGAGASSTSSASPALNTPNSASSLSWSVEFYGALAIGGLGLAFAL